MEQMEFPQMETARKFSRNTIREVLRSRSPDHLWTQNEIADQIRNLNLPQPNNRNILSCAITGLRQTGDLEIVRPGLYRIRKSKEKIMSPKNDSSTAETETYQSQNSSTNDHRSEDKILTLLNELLSEMTIRLVDLQRMRRGTLKEYSKPVFQTPTMPALQAMEVHTPMSPIYEYSPRLIRRVDAIRVAKTFNGVFSFNQFMSGLESEFGKLTMTQVSSHLSRLLRDGVIVRASGPRSYIMANYVDERATDKVNENVVLTSPNPVVKSKARMISRDCVTVMQSNPNMRLWTVELLRSKSVGTVLAGATAKQIANGIQTLQHRGIIEPVSRGVYRLKDSNNAISNQR